MEPERATSVVAKIGVESVLGALFAWLLTAASSAVVFFFVSRPWTVLQEVRWLLGASIGSAFGLLVLWWRRRRPVIYRYEYPPVTFRYEVLLRSCHYRIAPDGELRYWKRLRLKALQNQMTDYIDKVNWSGGPISLPRNDGSIEGISPVTDRVGMWTFYRVHFGRTLAKGEEIEFVLTWPSISDWVDSRPFVAMSTDEPTHRLEFHVQIPPAALKPSPDGSGCQAVFEHLRAVESLIPFRSQVTEFDENGRLNWVVNRPRLYRYFKVRWFWHPDLPHPDPPRPDPAHPDLAHPDLAHPDPPARGRWTTSIPGQMLPREDRQIESPGPPA